VSVGFLLTARGSGDLREPIASWLSERCDEDPELSLESTADQELLSVHPAAPAVEFSFIERGEMQVMASTSEAGPGYHIFVCDLLHDLTDALGLQWDAENAESCLDETGYFHSRDRSAPARKMTEWLASLEPGELGSLPLGPQEAPSLEQFPWLNEARDAAYHRNRALTLMWQKIRWRAPLTEEESEAQGAALAHLNTAWGMDPSLSYPAAEWHELASYLEASAPPVPDPGPSETPIGYLRQWMRIPVRGNWTIDIPGAFSFGFEGETWTAFDGETTVELTLFPFPGKQPEDILAEAFSRDRDETLETGPHDRRASNDYVEEDECFALNGLIAIPERLCVVNIYFASEELREQAMAIWRSIEARG